jgi:hypothetical protein
MYDDENEVEMSYYRELSDQEGDHIGNQDADDASATEFAEVEEAQQRAGSSLRPYAGLPNDAARDDVLRLCVNENVLRRLRGRTIDAIDTKCTRDDDTILSFEILRDCNRMLHGHIRDYNRFGHGWSSLGLTRTDGLITNPSFLFDIPV